MKLLVTGGAGFIGANFVRYWLKKYPQDTVVNLDALTYSGNLENLQDVRDSLNYVFVKGDICDPKAVSEVMQDVQVVVHFAAETHVDRSIMDPAPFIKTNVEGTYVLLQAALKHKVKRFHHVSTDEVYGALDLDSKEKFTEQSRYDPRSPYAASKAASDHLVRAFHTTYGLPITISNCSNNFGPYQFPEKLFGLAITNILEGKKVPLYGDGLHVRDWLYVEDHCSAIDLILQKGKVGETYLAGGSSEGISNLEIIKKILKIMGGSDSSIEFVKERPGHDRRYDVDWTKIKTELGWSPAHTLDEALAQTVQWYIANKQWWQHIKSGEYKEYYKKQYS